MFTLPLDKDNNPESINYVKFNSAHLYACNGVRNEHCRILLQTIQKNVQGVDILTPDQLAETFSTFEKAPKFNSEKWTK